MKTYNQFCEANKEAFTNLTALEKRYRYAYYVQGIMDSIKYE